MTLYTLLLIAAVILLFYIKAKINRLIDSIEEKISSVKEAIRHPRELAEVVGIAVADTAVHEAAKIINPKKKT